MPKAEWFGARLKERVPSATVTPIEQKGKMFIKVDGEQVYSKGGFNATNPQPTPAEVAELIESLTAKAAGKPLPLTDDEKAAFQALHDAQIAKGKSKH